MREKVSFDKPTLFLMLGLPGAGKTYTARQLAESLGIIHLQADEYRAELYENLEHSKEQDDVTERLGLLTLEKFMELKRNIVVDMELHRWGLRNEIRKLAKAHDYRYLIIWIQTDADTSFYRSNKRDRRSADNKFAVEVTDKEFDAFAAAFSKPRYEDYIVISGKHAFKTQLTAIVRKLKEVGAVRVTAPSGSRPTTTRTRISLTR